MKKLLLTTLFLFSLNIVAQSPVERALSLINRQNAETQIGILASDSLQGRKAGQQGGRMAAEYIKTVLKNAGIKPWKESFLHDFNMMKSLSSKQPNTKALSSPKNIPEYYRKWDMQNVLGIIEGKNKHEMVIVGAHYDHLGIRANKTNDSIYNGADDNASGTSAVLQIAKAFTSTAEKPERTVMFALWDGEEMGLLGSSYFMNAMDSDSTYKIKGYINLDMIGRNGNENDSIHSVDCYISHAKPVFEEWIQDGINKYDLKLQPVFKPLSKTPGGSDHMPFARRVIPVIFYFSGMHADYHRPSDHADRINYEKIVEITKSAYLNLWDMANRDDM